MLSFPVELATKRLTGSYLNRSSSLAKGPAVVVFFWNISSRISSVVYILCQFYKKKQFSANSFLLCPYLSNIGRNEKKGGRSVAISSPVLGNVLANAKTRSGKRQAKESPRN